MVYDRSLNPSTPSGVRRLLVFLTISPQKRKGQNFLIDQNLAYKITSALDIKTDGTILEVGGGLLSLSMPLIREGVRLITIEVDPAFRPWYEEAKKAHTNSDYFIADIRDVLNNIDNFFKDSPPPILLGNLPYYLSSHLLFILFPLTWWSRAVFTLQKEVAERLMAIPGSKERSPLTLMREEYARIEPVSELPPSVFYPPPRVTSWAVKFTRLEPMVSSPQEDMILRKIIFYSFAKKRKTVLNSLSMSSLNLEKEKVLNLLKETKIDPQLRAEDLSLTDFLNLTKAFLKHGYTLSNS